MKPPVVSVVIPLYNCAPFLREAMDSLLAQTFTDFELICINDGSTDDTEKIVLSYTDPRIRYFANDSNVGLVYTLNKGIELSTGEFIARMDGDDWCYPERFGLQVDFFRQHPDARVLATTIELMDENGKPIGYWEDERRAITPAQIRKKLPKDNCIAHPTVMARAEIFRQFRYDGRQRQAEDYDLWLRIAAAGIPVNKLDNALVKHRIVRNSFTRKRQRNVFWKNARTKRVFLSGFIFKSSPNLFIMKVFFFMVVDLGKGVGKKIKQLLKF